MFSISLKKVEFGISIFGGGGFSITLLLLLLLLFLSDFNPNIDKNFDLKLCGCGSSLFISRALTVLTQVTKRLSMFKPDLELISM